MTRGRVCTRAALSKSYFSMHRTNTFMFSCNVLGVLREIMNRLPAVLADSRMRHEEPCRRASFMKGERLMKRGKVCTRAAGCASRLTRIIELHRAGYLSVRRWRSERCVRASVTRMQRAGGHRQLAPDPTLRAAMPILMPDRPSHRERNARQYERLLSSQNKPTREKDPRESV